MKTKIKKELNVHDIIHRMVSSNHSVCSVEVKSKSKFAIYSLAKKATFCRITKEGIKAFNDKNFNYFSFARAACHNDEPWTK